MRTATSRHLVTIIKAAAIDLPFACTINPRKSIGIFLMVLSLGLLTTGVVLAAVGDISTAAGTGGAGFSGDGAAATSAQLNNPLHVAVDSSGNLFIADFFNNRIRKVTLASPTLVPGVSTWGLIGLALLMGAAAFFMLRRRKLQQA